MSSLRLCLAVAVLLTLPHAAQAFELKLSNQSRLTVSGLSLYPLDASGAPIEDNLGGSYSPLAPGATAQIAIAATCGPMFAVVTIDKSNDLQLSLDTCTDKTIIVRD